MKEVESYADKSTQILILGNKSDLVDSKVVDTEMVQRYCDSKGFLYFETSAKNNECIGEAFGQVSEKLVERKEKNTVKRGNMMIFLTVYRNESKQEGNHGRIKKIKKTQWRRRRKNRRM